MKRVLLITQYYPPENGAAQVRLASLTSWLNEHDVHVEVVCPFPNYPEGKIRTEDQGKFSEKISERRGHADHLIHRYWLYSAMGKGMMRLLAYLSFCLTSFASVSKVQKPDLVLVNSGPLFLALPGLFLAWNFKVPCNLIVADIWPRSIEYIGGSFAGKTFLWMMKQLERFAYSHSDEITAVTQGIVDYLKMEENIPTQKIRFLPNGVDLKLFEQKKTKTREELGLPPADHFLFVYPGNMGNAHALESMLEVAHLFQQENNQKFHFLFIGGGSEKPKLSQLKDRLNLKNVTFKESVPMSELVHYIRAADCGLIHMKNSDLANETRPAKMFPLMAASLPILFCGFGEGQNLLKHQSELFCEPENVQQIFNKIKSMPSTEQLKAYGLKNRQLVEESFSVESLIAAWWKQVARRL